MHLLCAFRVVADSFVSLYVSEFLIAACGVSPLRGRPKDSALWNLAALERLANFLVWVRVCWCCALDICQVMTAKALRLTNQTQSTLCADA